MTICHATIGHIYLQLKTLPESVIVETTEYKCLQSQFSVLYNESMQMKTQLEENMALLQTSKNTHLRQIEQMEVSVTVENCHLKISRVTYIRFKIKI